MRHFVLQPINHGTRFCGVLMLPSAIGSNRSLVWRATSFERRSGRWAYVSESVRWMTSGVALRELT